VQDRVHLRISMESSGTWTSVEGGDGGGASRVSVIGFYPCW